MTKYSAFSHGCTNLSYHDGSHGYLCMYILRPDKGIHSVYYNDMGYRYIDSRFQVNLPESGSRSQPASSPLERDLCAVRVQGGMLPDHLFRRAACVLCASEEECSVLSGEL